MRRIHFIEIEDAQWCPASIRDAVTSYLQFVIEKTNPYGVVIEKLQNALAAAGSRKIIDLCSGGGGAWQNLIPPLLALEPQTEVYLTDKYPNVSAFERLRTRFPKNLGFSTAEIDAARIPFEFKGFRTLFSSFHHFEPEAARRILQDAVSKNEGIAVFEFTQRKFSAILVMLLTPLFVFLVTPFIRPFRFSIVFWTYIIPLVPLIVGFDGIVSCLRTYQPEELLELTRGLSGKYKWEAGELPVKGSLVPVTFLIGRPAAN